jgi:mono/diheme cytochrome c family protein
MSISAARRGAVTMCVAVLLSVCASAGAVLHAARAVAPAASGPQDATRSTRSPEELYRWACAACHGLDGTGAARDVVGFDTPLPDFSDCSFASVEPDADWLAVAHDGGPARAFDRRMPAFGEALSEAEIQQTLNYIRGFCTNPAWPRGELNLPRPLVTEKAFPENETVLTTSIGTGSLGVVATELLYERRFGARNQFEVAVPVAVQEATGGQWRRGLGDIALAVKRALFHSLEAGNLLSAGGELIVPTGKETLGLGKGVTSFEPFVAFGQILPRNAFLQVQAGAEVPADHDRAADEAFWRATVGTSLEQSRFGRVWSPMVELLGARELRAGESAQWDVVPQMQLTLSKRQHIMINGGVRIPLTGRDERRAQVITYFLWDWFDGGLFEGWR